MKLADLALDLCYKLGEGYQNYIDRAEAHLTDAFNNLILSGNADESEYFGLIQNYDKTITEEEISVNDITGSNAVEVLKILSVIVDDAIYDMISNTEYEHIDYLSAFITTAYYFKKGSLYLVGLTGVSWELSVRFIQVFKDASPTPLELNNYFTNSFLDKAEDMAMKTLYAEINA